MSIFDIFRKKRDELPHEYSYEGERIDYTHLFFSAPNPELQRENTLSLNGMGHITTTHSNLIPNDFPDIYFVPFPLDSLLSTYKRVNDKNIYYHIMFEFEVDESFLKDVTKIYFMKLCGEYTIYLNGSKILEGKDKLFVNANVSTLINAGLNTIILTFKEDKFANVIGPSGPIYLESTPNNHIESVFIKTDIKNEKVIFNLDTDSPKAFWTSLMALLLKIVLFVSGIVLIGLVAFLLYYFGGLLGQITGVAMLMYLLPIPALIGLLVFVFGFRLMFMPLFYYLNNDNSLSITKAFNASVRTMREQGKGTMFFIDFIHLFINGAYIGLAVFVSMFLLGQDVDAMKIIGVIAIILFLVIYILFASRLGIAHRVAKLKLLEDIMIDPNLAENPQLVKEKMIKQGLSKDEFLVKLFDKNQEEALEADKEEKEDKQENK